MKSVEINDLLSYHFYGNLKVKDGVKVFVDGVAAEKDNAYEYTLKCVKDDKVYDLTFFWKRSRFILKMKIRFYSVEIVRILKNLHLYIVWH